MGGRWIHPASGRIYHTVNNPPREAEKDDLTGDDLIQRSDDQEATVRERLTVYHQQTSPLVAYYQDQAQNQHLTCHSIAGLGAVADVKARILSAITDHRER